MFNDFELRDVDMDAGTINPSDDERKSTVEHKVQKRNTYFIFSFSYQRRFLNYLDYPPTVDDIEEMWPILLKFDFFLWHYKLLMGHFIRILLDSFKSIALRIFAYGHQKNKNSDSEMTEEEVFRIIAEHFESLSFIFALGIAWLINLSRFLLPYNFFFASYFVFNKHFPRTNSMTLDFVQRIMLNMDPNMGKKQLTLLNSSKEL